MVEGGKEAKVRSVIFIKQHPCSSHLEIQYRGFPWILNCHFMLPHKKLKSGNFFDRLLGNFTLTGYEKHVGWWLVQLGWLVSLRAAGPKIPYSKNFQIEFLGGNKIVRHTPPKFKIDPVLLGRYIFFQGPC